MSPDSVRHAREMLASFREPPVAVHISMPLKKKRWPKDHFARLIEFIVAKYKRGVLIIMDPHDSLPCGSLLNEVLMRCDYKMARPACFLDLVALLSFCSEVIAHDGAIVHIAAGLNKPTLGIYVQANVKAYHPWGVPHVVLAGRESAEDISIQSACEGYSKLQEETKALRA